MSVTRSVTIPSTSSAYPLLADIIYLLERNRAVCQICEDHFDDFAPGSKAPITPSCCGNTVCRECVVAFHAAKQESVRSQLKHFPCLSCNMPKALNIELLPVPHTEFLAVISVMKKLASKAPLALKALSNEAAQLAIERDKSSAQESELIALRAESFAQKSELITLRADSSVQESELISLKAGLDKMINKSKEYPEASRPSFKQHNKNRNPETWTRVHAKNDATALQIANDNMATGAPLSAVPAASTLLTSLSSSAQTTSTNNALTQLPKFRLPHISQPKLILDGSGGDDDDDDDIDDEEDGEAAVDNEIDGAAGATANTFDAAAPGAATTAADDSPAEETATEATAEASSSDRTFTSTILPPRPTQQFTTTVPSQLSSSSSSSSPSSAFLSRSMQFDSHLQTKCSQGSLESPDVWNDRKKYTGTGSRSASTSNSCAARADSGNEAHSQKMPQEGKPELYDTNSDSDGLEGVTLGDLVFSDQPAYSQRRQPRRKADVAENKELRRDDSKDQWVQCDACDKWRLVTNSFRSLLQSKEWFCSMNVTDPDRSSCDAAEVEYGSSEEEDDEEAQRDKMRTATTQAKLETKQNDIGSDDDYEDEDVGGEYDCDEGINLDQKLGKKMKLAVSPKATTAATVPAVPAAAAAADAGASSVRSSSSSSSSNSRLPPWRSTPLSAWPPPLPTPLKTPPAPLHPLLRAGARAKEAAERMASLRVREARVAKHRAGQSAMEVVRFQHTFVEQKLGMSLAASSEDLRNLPVITYMGKVDIIRNTCMMRAAPGDHIEMVNEHRLLGRRFAKEDAEKLVNQLPRPLCIGFVTGASWARACEDARTAARKKKLCKDAVDEARRSCENFAASVKASPASAQRPRSPRGRNHNDDDDDLYSSSCSYSAGYSALSGQGNSSSSSSSSKRKRKGEEFL